MPATIRLLPALWLALLTLVGIQSFHTAQAAPANPRRTYTIYLPMVIGPPPGRIAFTAAVGSSSDIYTVNGDGTHLNRLGIVSQIAGRPQNPIWSPDGQRIAFTAWSSLKNTSTIYVTQVDGTGLVRLTESEADSQPAWSPDGQRIAFVSTRSGNGQVYIMRADGSQQTAITAPTSQENDVQPAWSPDSKQIVFVRVSPTGSDVYLINAAGGQPTRLTKGSGTSPIWSPDGQQIVCVMNNALYVVRTNGSQPTRISGTSEASYSGLAWSHDGQRIIFAASQSGNYDIYTVATNGSSQIRLTTNAADDISPLPSPDDTRLAFLSYSGDRWIINTVRLDGTQQQRITTIGVTSWPIAWAPLL